MERRVGGAVTQRSAKPFRRVRLSYVPPEIIDSSNLRAIFILIILLAQGMSAGRNDCGLQKYAPWRLVNLAEIWQVQ